MGQGLRWWWLGPKLRLRLQPRPWEWRGRQLFVARPAVADVSAAPQRMRVKSACWFRRQDRADIFLERKASCATERGSLIRQHQNGLRRCRMVGLLGCRLLGCRLLGCCLRRCGLCERRSDRKRHITSVEHVADARFRVERELTQVPLCGVDGVAHTRKNGRKYGRQRHRD